MGDEIKSRKQLRIAIIIFLYEKTHKSEKNNSIIDVRDLEKEFKKESQSDIINGLNYLEGKDLIILEKAISPSRGKRISLTSSGEDFAEQILISLEEENGPSIGF
jgi:hypothetical protein